MFGFEAGQWGGGGAEDAQVFGGIRDWRDGRH